MARYFFHLIDGTFLPDTTGVELNTLADAQDEAIPHLAAAIAARGPSFWRRGSFRLVVTDDAGETFFELNLSAQSYEGSAPRLKVAGPNIEAGHVALDGAGR